MARDGRCMYCGEFAVSCRSARGYFGAPFPPSCSMPHACSLLFPIPLTQTFQVRP